MSALKRNEHGLMVRANSYGRASYDELARELGLGRGEGLYMAGVNKGVRKGKVIQPDSEDISYKPGDTFIAGPRITKASGLIGQSYRRGQGMNKHVPISKAAVTLPPGLKRDVEQLRCSGFGAVPAPEMTQWGWAVRMKGLVLPDGSRTDAMILLPSNYPMASPIGFYLRQGAAVGNLDTSHLYNSAYHGALDLTSEGWQWFCGIAEGWKPGRHTLLTYITMVFALLDDKSTF